MHELRFSSPAVKDFWFAGADAPGIDPKGSKNIRAGLSMHDVLYGLVGEWGQIDRCILADTLVDLEDKFNTYCCPGALPLACPAIGRASCPLAY